MECLFFLDHTFLINDCKHCKDPFPVFVMLIKQGHAVKLSCCQGRSFLVVALFVSVCTFVYNTTTLPFLSIACRTRDNAQRDESPARVSLYIFTHFLLRLKRNLLTELLARIGEIFSLLSLLSKIIIKTHLILLCSIISL